MMFVMSIAPLPTPLQQLGGRRFAFYPPIRNIRHNEWLFRRTTWTECIVMNTRTGEEIGVPRVFLGEVSFDGGPSMVVALYPELEWRGGAIVPHERCVIELPVRGTEEQSAPPRTGARAQVVSIRLEQKPQARTSKWMGAALVLGIVTLSIAAGVARQALTQRSDFRGYRGFLQLDRADDYRSAVRKLGKPISDRIATQGGRMFRLLTYRAPGFSPARFSIVLMADTPAEPRYIGAVDARGRVLDAVASSDSILHSLPAF